MVCLLFERIVEETPDTIPLAFTAFRFNRKALLRPPMSGCELTMFGAAIILVFKVDVEASANEASRNIYFVACSSELLRVTQPSDQLFL